MMLKEISQKVVVALASSAITAAVTTLALFLAGAFHKVVIDAPIRSEIVRQLERDQVFLNLLASDGRFRGERGLVGPTGASGPEGALGPQGPMGPVGDRGPKGQAANVDDLRQAIASEVAKVIGQTSDLAKLKDLVEQQALSAKAIRISVGSSASLLDGKLAVAVSWNDQSRECMFNLVGVSAKLLGERITVGDTISLTQFGLGAYRLHLDEVEFSSCTVHIGL